MVYRAASTLAPPPPRRGEPRVCWHPGGRHLVGSLAVHLGLLVAASMARPVLGPDPGQDAPLTMATVLIQVSHHHPHEPDEEEPPPRVATRATSPERLRPDERFPDEEPEPPRDPARPTLHAGFLDAVLPPVVHAMPTERGAGRAPGLLEVDRRREVDPAERLRRASWHVVARGESLSSIAQRYGLRSHLDLYNDRLNPELLARRPDPDVIRPGDRVRIPVG